MCSIGYITQHESKDHSTLYARVHHSFDFRIHRDFRKLYQGRRYSRYVIDLGGIAYIDSAALGMLMLLYRHADEDSRAVALINCHSAVLEILRIARFGRFFDIPGLDGGEAVPPVLQPCYAA